MAQWLENMFHPTLEKIPQETYLLLCEITVAVIFKKEAKCCFFGVENTSPLLLICVWLLRDIVGLAVSVTEKCI